jgi:hypothetical protein
VGLGVAKINQDAIAHISGDEAPIAFNDKGSTPFKAQYQIPQVFRIHVRGHFGRTDDIAEQYGQVPTFSFWRRVSCCFWVNDRAKFEATTSAKA